MVATFYENLSDNRVINKKLKELKTNINIVLKDDTDILNPTFILQTDNDIINSNYIYVSELKRYYYIEDITLSQNRIIVTAKVDVLNTYKDDILNLKVILKRQENKYNTYLNDENYKALEYSFIHTLNFPNGFTSQSYILAICGGES